MSAAEAAPVGAIARSLIGCEEDGPSWRVMGAGAFVTESPRCNASGPAA
jgi:hypothetical protein